MAVWKWIVGTAATWTLAGIWIRLLFSLAVGMFIGIDRGLKRRGAGHQDACSGLSGFDACHADERIYVPDIPGCQSRHGRTRARR
ncbi:MAG: hypothetical protein ACLT76_03390 [Clostridium fessum]